MDGTDFMPDGATLAAIREEIERYESLRASAKRRVLWRVPVYWLAVMLVVAGLAIAFNGMASPYEQWTSTPHVFLYVAGAVAIVLSFVSARAPARKLHATFRQTVLPMVFGFIDDLSYQTEDEPRSFDRLPREALGEFDDASFDDVISGSFGGFSFELYEANLEQSSAGSTSTVYKGLIVTFQAAAPFPGVLIATVRSNRKASLLRSILGGGELDELKSGVTELDSLYEFRTDNAEAARPLVEGRLAKALQWLGESWPSEPARIVLKGDDGFLLLPSTKNFFELPGDSVPLDFDAHIRPMIADMASILAIVSLVRKVSE